MALDEPKHPGGRPPIFSTPEELQAAVDDYFKWVEGEYEDVETEEEGEKVKKRIWHRHPEHMTITGLALHVGFCSRGTLYEYEKKPEFSDIVKRAMTRVEQSYEFNLRSTTPTGSIFALKNMGWKDRVEQEHSGGDKPLRTETHIKIIRDTASSIAPGEFTPQPATGTESEETL